MSIFKLKYGSAVPENQLKAIVNQMSSPWMIDFVRLNPVDYLERVKCPVLALNGDKDLQVPLEENLNLIQSTLKNTGNRKVKIIEYESLNHLFQECETGAVSEYGTIRQTIDPKVMGDIVKWVLKQ